MDPSEKFMRAALNEARKAQGRTSPNPLVGAVLIVRDRIAARAYHRQAGLPHAEVECLRKFGTRVPADAVLYVTMEPCSTVGRTPACTDTIIESGLKKIVVGTIDPNPHHSGRGIERLRAAGIEVVVGTLDNECTALNAAFNKWIVSKTPFVIAKCAITLDGRLTRPENEMPWISNPKSRAEARALRGQVDAIIVGATTVRKDNPRLTVRDSRGSKQPFRVVLTRSAKFSKQSHIFTDRFKERTLVYRNQSLRAVLADLGQKDVNSVLIEGGGEILGQALDAGLIDRVYVYLAPIVTGGGTMAFAGEGANKTSAAARLHNVEYKMIDQDLRISGDVRYGGSSAE